MRSKVERIWAQHFSRSGLHWKYELVTFGKKERYTPDFYIIEKDIFIEIKVEYGRRLNQFHLCQWPLLLIFGTPDRHYAYFKQRGATDFDRTRMTNWRVALDRILA